MKTTQTLPENYGEILIIDLQNNKKLLIIVNALAIILAATMVVPVCFFIPFSTLFDMSDGLVSYILRFAVLFIGSIGYVILHEAVHGTAMRAFGAVHTRFGFTGIYAFAGSEKDYFGKWQYIIIALAPLVLFGILFAIALLFPMPRAWFWVIYFLQVMNVSGSAGDLFVSLRLLTLPCALLVRDTGTRMTVYTEK